MKIFTIKTCYGALVSGTLGALYQELLGRLEGSEKTIEYLLKDFFLIIVEQTYYISRLDDLRRSDNQILRKICKPEPKYRLNCTLP